MKRFPRKSKLHRAALFLALALFAIPALVQAQAVDNGSVTGSPAANSGIQAGNAPPWDRCTFSPDLCSVTFASYTGNSAVPRVASPDGGTWLGVAALGECAETTISGLTVGSNYTLYFCGANFGTAGLYNATTVNVLVTVGASSQTYTIPQVANTWNPYSLNFTANATTMALMVTAPSGSNGYGSLDGFNLSGTLCSPVVLSEVLESFSGTHKDCQVQLDWEALGDQTIESFEIQRSHADDKFETLETVYYQTSGQYSFTDPYPYQEGRYRLRVGYQDGSVGESEVIRISGNCQGQGLEVLPNPVQFNGATTLRFFTREATTKLSISNLSGQVVKVLELSTIPGAWNETVLSTVEMESGVYIITSNNGGITKMVIQ